MSIPISKFIPPPHLVTICLLSTSVSLFLFCQVSVSYVICIIFIDSAYKLYDIGFLFLTYFTLTVSRSIHISVNGTIYLFLWLSYIPLCIYVYTHTHTHTHTHHIFFIHFSVDGHLYCLHELAIVNSPALNIGVHLSFGIAVFSGYMPRSGILCFNRACFSASRCH